MLFLLVTIVLETEIEGYVKRKKSCEEVCRPTAFTTSRGQKPAKKLPLVAVATYGGCGRSR